MKKRAVWMAAGAAFALAAFGADDGANAPGPAPAATAFKAGDVPIYAELDEGESITFELADGAAHTLELAGFSRTSAQLLIDGKPQEVKYRPQDLPITVAGMRVGVEITKAWSDAQRFAWFGLKKDCRLFLSDASRPVMTHPEGVYPLSPAPTIAGGTIWGGGWLSERRPAQRDCHIGFDVYGPVGTRILAIEDVVVTDVRVDQDYGDMIVIEMEGKRFRYSFLHLSEAHVKPGQALKRGDEVGLVGQTGYCAYPHLHVHMMLPGAVSKDGPVREGRGVNVNPGPYIHDMYARLDAKQLVDFNKVTLKAVDPDGNRVPLTYYHVKLPDGRTCDIGIHDSTSVPVGKNPFTFVAEHRKLGLRGEVTVSVERSGQEVTVVMQKAPVPDTKPAE